MSSTEFVALTLSLSASGYAGLAAERLLSNKPELVVRFGEGAFRLWKENLAGRVEELAAAVRSEDPARFARQVAWAQVAFESRGSEVEDLRDSLVCLQEVLSEELPDNSGQTIVKFVQAALDELRKPSDRAAGGLSLDTAHGRLAAQYLEQLLDGRRTEARHVVLDAVESGRLEIKDAYLKVLIPAEVEVGRMWHQNELGVAEEHFVSSTTRMVMNQLLDRAERGEPLGKTVVTAAVQGNAHDIAISTLADFFEMDGWNVIQLGCDIPTPDLAAAVRSFSADLVALSVTLEVQRPQAQVAITKIRELSPARILVGGAAFLGGDNLWKAVGADGFAASIPDAIERGRELVE